MNFQEELKKHHAQTDLSTANIWQLLSAGVLWQDRKINNENRDFSAMLKRCYNTLNDTITYVHKTDAQKTTCCGCWLSDFYESEEIEYLTELIRAAKERIELLTNVD